MILVGLSSILPCTICLNVLDVDTHTHTNIHTHNTQVLCIPSCKIIIFALIQIIMSKYCWVWTSLTGFHLPGTSGGDDPRLFVCLPVCQSGTSCSGPMRACWMTVLIVWDSFNGLCVFAWRSAAAAASREGVGLCQSVHPADHRPGHLRERGGLPGLLQSSK